MYRILIVEDDAGIAEAVSEQAKMRNFETHSVTNFRNVMAEFAEFDPHLVLMDIGLPFFTGNFYILCFGQHEYSYGHEYGR